MIGEKVICIVYRDAMGDRYEYSLLIRPFGDCFIDVDCIGDIKEEIDEHFDELVIDGATELVLIEDWEAEDVFGHRFFTTVSINPIVPDDVE